MTFQAGNQLWKARASSGRKPIFKCKEDLEKSCIEYFQWVEDNPLQEMKAFHYQGTIIKEPIPKMRAMTISGICLFLDISDETWRDYRTKDDFSGVIAWAEKIIYNQKFAGASADLLNANIIARDLGLADKQEVKQDSKVVEIATTMSPEDAAKAYTEMMEGK